MNPLKGYILSSVSRPLDGRPPALPAVLLRLAPFFFRPAHGLFFTAFFFCHTPAFFFLFLFFFFLRISSSLRFFSASFCASSCSLCLFSALRRASPAFCSLIFFRLASSAIRFSFSDGSLLRTFASALPSCAPYPLFSSHGQDVALPASFPLAVPPVRLFSLPLSAFLRLFLFPPDVFSPPPLFPLSASAFLRESVLPPACASSVLPDALSSGAVPLPLSALLSYGLPRLPDVTA